MDRGEATTLDSLMDAAEAADALRLIGPAGVQTDGEAYFDQLTARDMRPARRRRSAPRTKAAR